MKILLISPLYNTHIVAPHLGLGYLGSALKKGGHSVKVLDGLREEIVYDPKEYDLVGVTAMSTYFPEAIEEVKRAKSFGLKTIIGGPHVIAIPQQSLIDAGSDYACVGEGEITLLQLANGLKPEECVGLLYYNDKGEITLSQGKNGNKEDFVEFKYGDTNRKFYKDIDEFDRPDWDLIDPRTYPKAPHGMIAREFPLAPIITTRGCPYRCTYCSAPMTAGKGMRYRDPIKVVDEIEMLIKKYGVKEVQIEDDNFTVKRDHAFAVCKEILKRKIKINWSLPNGVRIDKLDPELLGIMAQSGCYLMALGIESANQRILDMVKKRLNVKVVRKVTKWVNEAGIEAWGFFMIGFPTETREEMQETIKFALSLPLTRGQFTKATPLPGTDLYSLWFEKYSDGKKINWANFNYYTFETNWAGVSSEELKKIQFWGHFKFYFRFNQFWTIIKHLRFEQYITAFKRLINLKFGTTNYIINSKK